LCLERGREGGRGRKGEDMPTGGGLGEASRIVDSGVYATTQRQKKKKALSNGWEEMTVWGGRFRHK